MDKLCCCLHQGDGLGNSCPDVLEVFKSGVRHREDNTMLVPLSSALVCPHCRFGQWRCFSLEGLSWREDLDLVIQSESLMMASGILPGVMYQEWDIIVFQYTDCMGW